ncbi:hypothetical protein [Pontibacter ruber]|uniref:Uncharacterized protein n=1 Tax=Pontibacter ruber TaxID=1343895 RepID=A0ABW5CS37_9BACT|nr:hypothetical protein [Pontibacter ruber]
MRPEDIDKLFKERLGNSSPTPPTDLWSKLQERIEDEMPAAAPQKEEKQRFMWVYQAAAAVVAILLTVGILFNNLKQEPAATGTIAQQTPAAQTQQPAPAEEPATEQAIASTETQDKVILQEEAAKETVTELKKPEMIAKAELKTQIKSPAVKRTERQQTLTDRALAAAPKYKKPGREESKPEPAVTTMPEAPVVLAAANTNEDLNAQPVEITFKFANARTEEPAPQQEEPSDLKKKGRLAKNIFKQVRNLSNGEPVELSALGINADRVALETKIGKQKISKVINL